MGSDPCMCTLILLGLPCIPSVTHLIELLWWFVCYSQFMVYRLPNKFICIYILYTCIHTHMQRDVWDYSSISWIVPEHEESVHMWWCDNLGRSWKSKNKDQSSIVMCKKKKKKKKMTFLSLSGLRSYINPTLDPTLINHSLVPRLLPCRKMDRWMNWLGEEPGYEAK